MNKTKTGKVTLFLLIVTVISANTSMAQRKTSDDHERKLMQYQAAVGEVDIVLDRTRLLTDPRSVNIVKAKAANVIWTYNKVEAEGLFRLLWKMIDRELDDPKFDKEAARMDLLEQLFPRDPKLAYKLIDELESIQQENEPVSDRINGMNPGTRRSAFLSYRIAEDDEKLAASLIAQGSIANTAPSFPLVLNRIRSKDPLLSNRVIKKVLSNFDSQPPTVALVGILAIAAHIFPYTPQPPDSVEAYESDQEIRLLFTRGSLATLRRSLAEKEAALLSLGYTPDILAQRKFNQTLVASILAVLTPYLSPVDGPEMIALAAAMREGFTPDELSMMEMQLSVVKAAMQQSEDDSDESAIVNAIARQDFSKAEFLISGLKMEIKRTLWLDALYRAMAYSFLRSGEMDRAIDAAERISTDQGAVAALLDILGRSSISNDEESMTKALNKLEDRAKNMRPGARARLRFIMAGHAAKLKKTEALLLLNEAVSALNSLFSLKSEGKLTGNLRGENYWEDPDNFANSRLFGRAFALVGESNLQDTLTIAASIRDNATSYVARISAVEKIVVKGPPAKPKMRHNTSKKLVPKA
jgi:hypothetical protein